MIGKTMELERGWCVIGTHGECDIRMDAKNPDYAEVHAFIAVRPRGVFLYSVDKKLPVILPRQKQSLLDKQESILQTNDVFLIGKRKFRVSFESPIQEIINDAAASSNSISVPDDDAELQAARQTESKSPPKTKPVEPAQEKPVAQSVLKTTPSRRRRRSSLVVRVTDETFVPITADPKNMLKRLPPLAPLNDMMEEADEAAAAAESGPSAASKPVSVRGARKPDGLPPKADNAATPRTPSLRVRKTRAVPSAAPAAPVASKTPVRQTKPLRTPSKADTTARPGSTPGTRNTSTRRTVAGSARKATPARLTVKGTNVLPPPASSKKPAALPSDANLSVTEKKKLTFERLSRGLPATPRGGAKAASQRKIRPAPMQSLDPSPESSPTLVKRKSFKKNESKPLVAKMAERIEKAISAEADDAAEAESVSAKSSSGSPSTNKEVGVIQSRLEQIQITTKTAEKVLFVEEDSVGESQPDDSSKSSQAESPQEKFTEAPRKIVWSEESRDEHISAERTDAVDKSVSSGGQVALPAKNQDMGEIHTPASEGAPQDVTPSSSEGHKSSDLAYAFGRELSDRSSKDTDIAKDSQEGREQDNMDMIAEPVIETPEQVSPSGETVIADVAEVDQSTMTEKGIDIVVEEDSHVHDHDMGCDAAANTTEKDEVGDALQSQDRVPSEGYSSKQCPENDEARLDDATEEGALAETNSQTENALSHGDNEAEVVQTPDAKEVALVNEVTPSVEAEKHMVSAGYGRTCEEASDMEVDVNSTPPKQEVESESAVVVNLADNIVPSSPGEVTSTDIQRKSSIDGEAMQVGEKEMPGMEVEMQTGSKSIENVQDASLELTQKTEEPEDVVDATQHRWEAVENVVSIPGVRSEEVVSTSVDVAERTMDATVPSPSTDSSSALDELFNSSEAVCSPNSVLSPDDVPAVEASPEMVGNPKATIQDVTLETEMYVTTEVVPKVDAGTVNIDERSGVDSMDEEAQVQTGLDKSAQVTCPADRDTTLTNQAMEIVEEQDDKQEPATESAFDQIVDQEQKAENHEAMERDVDEIFEKDSVAVESSEVVEVVIPECLAIVESGVPVVSQDKTADENSKEESGMVVETEDVVTDNDAAVEPAEMPVVDKDVDVGVTEEGEMHVEGEKVPVSDFIDVGELNPIVAAQGDVSPTETREIDEAIASQSAVFDESLIDVPVKGNVKGSDMELETAEGDEGTSAEVDVGEGENPADEVEPTNQAVGAAAAEEEICEEDDEDYVDESEASDDSNSDHPLDEELDEDMVDNNVYEEEDDEQDLVEADSGFVDDNDEGINIDEDEEVQGVAVTRSDVSSNLQTSNTPVVAVSTSNDTNMMPASSSASTVEEKAEEYISAPLTDDEQEMCADVLCTPCPAERESRQEIMAKASEMAVQLERKTVKDLRPILKERGLVTSGLKRDMIMRILSHEGFEDEIVENVVIVVSTPRSTRKIGGGISALGMASVTRRSTRLTRVVEDDSSDSAEEASESDTDDEADEDNALHDSDVYSPAPLGEVDSNAAASESEDEGNNSEGSEDARKTDIQYRNKTVKELRKMLTDRSVDLPAKMKKDELIEQLMGLTIADESAEAGEDIDEAEEGKDENEDDMTIVLKTAKDMKLFLKDHGMCQVGTKAVLSQRVDFARQGRSIRTRRSMAVDPSMCSACKEGERCSGE